MSFVFLDEVWGPKKEKKPNVMVGPKPPLPPRTTPTEHPVPNYDVPVSRPTTARQPTAPREAPRERVRERPREYLPMAKPPIEWIPARTQNVYAGHKGMAKYGHHFFSHETWMFIFAALFLGIIFFLYRIANCIGKVYDVMKLKNEFGFQ